MQMEMFGMAEHRETCTDCGTRYNAVANADCPYCDFPNFPETMRSN